MRIEVGVVTRRNVFVLNEEILVNSSHFLVKEKIPFVPGNIFEVCNLFGPNVCRRVSVGYLFGIRISSNNFL